MAGLKLLTDRPSFCDPAAIDKGSDAVVGGVANVPVDVTVVV